MNPFEQRWPNDAVTVPLETLEDLRVVYCGHQYRVAAYDVDLPAGRLRLDLINDDPRAM